MQEMPMTTKIIIGTVLLFGIVACGGPVASNMTGAAPSNLQAQVFQGNAAQCSQTRLGRKVIVVDGEPGGNLVSCLGYTVQITGTIDAVESVLVEVGGISQSVTVENGSFSIRFVGLTNLSAATITPMDSSGDLMTNSAAIIDLATIAAN